MVVCYGAIVSSFPSLDIKQYILDELHDSHQGTSRMKERAVSQNCGTVAT